MKRAVQTIVRGAHLALLRKPLPDRICLYGHSLAGRLAALDAFLSRFSDMGYRFVGPDPFFEQSGRMILLSFDDNYRSWYDALPVFERRGAVATFYVNTLPFRDTASADELTWFFTRISAEVEPTLSTDDLRSMAACGQVIGAHTHTHPLLSAVPHEEAKREIAQSKEILEDVLGTGIAHFAYPFGMRRHFTKALQDDCFELGFRTVATGIPCQHFGPLQPGLIHRTCWDLDAPFERNLENIAIDGRLYERLTGYNPTAGGY
ncbi:polysaccharide deacetylase family protein [Blastochloris sulfoviridis]|uniref:Chitooligosaccharide deacetylase n=1 Tax=Blastochloris sulfoviridis TaxID=50712 RepID=A0A5M6HT68_9HYPH|nr:polysaccharide deacetylase family protein [Blastochloris sulfoviridis]KAA5598981.1 polysaccharide deacetylase family protein [Blastochloris sulfoviridis]